jgi:hypothetical protein
MSRRTLYFSLILLVLGGLNIGVSQAQGLPPVSGLQLTLSDPVPSPGQTVTVTAQSYSFEINTANIVWTVDGRINTRGIGLTKIDITAPAAGKKRTVNVSATTPQGRTYTSSISVGSGSIDLIIETDGYVPPFFRGKTPMAYQNKIKVIAIPHLANAAGTEYAVNSLVYTWNRNGTVLQDQSGYGKQTITMLGDIVPRDYTLTVNVSSRDNANRAEETILIKAGEPSITFYNEDPLYGPLFNRSVSGTIRIGTERELGIRAVPFGFSRPTIDALSFNWRINGAERTELNNHESLILRAQENTVGISNIQLAVRNLENILQGSEASFSAIFTATAPETAQKDITF